MTAMLITLAVALGPLFVVLDKLLEDDEDTVDAEAKLQGRT